MSTLSNIPAHLVPAMTEFKAQISDYTEEQCQEAIKRIELVIAEAKQRVVNYEVEMADTDSEIKEMLYADSIDNNHRAIDGWEAQIEVLKGQEYRAFHSYEC